MPLTHSESLLILSIVAVLAAAVAVGLWLGERAARRRLAAELRDGQSKPRPASAGAVASPASAAGWLDRRELEAVIERQVAVSAQAGESSLPFLLWVALDDLRKLQHEQLAALVDVAVATLCGRLAAAAPRGASVARLGPADHAVFLGACSAPEALALGEALRIALAEPLDMAGRDVRMSCSIGIASGRHEAKMLCARAAVAMRSVRHAGGDGVALFDPNMAQDERERAELMADLREAVQRKQLEIYYQPSVDTRTMQVSAAEALLRWRHPRRGLVPPTEFLRLAEQGGAIEAIGNWVIDSVMDQAADWQKRKLGIRVAVNLSHFQTRQDTLAPRIEQGLRAHRLRPDALCCEIDAPLIADDANAGQRLMARLAKIGVQLSIDNFGRADSGLAMLRRLPVEEVKLARSLVAELGEDSGADARCKAIIDMAHSRGQRVVGTGVETEDQRDELMALGCDALQGHLFAKAMSPKALALWASDSPQTRAELFRATLFKETQPFEDGVAFAPTMPFDPDGQPDGQPDAQPPGGTRAQRRAG